jgi:DMSO/TMAO reductase YedYZ heme-binding membrane subunit/nitrite reductase/ring-hydroxylating ferredoxin subunit
MSVIYDAVHWTPSKKKYDRVMLALMGGYLVFFSALELILQPQITAETLIIRASGTLAFLMLHVILLIGPLCRLYPVFLPLLYNRRHFGVSMFLMALFHGMLTIFQFHALGNINPLESLFESNVQYNSMTRFPFETAGFLALVILFLMASTSHDFWLKNLTPRVWKALHMLVYLAYFLLVMHVMLGVIQLEQSPVLIGLIGAGICLITMIHLAAGLKQARADAGAQRFNAHLPVEVPENFVFACRVDEIQDNRAKMLIIGRENIAVFKYDGKLSAVHNLCKHQNGPLGEGKIIDGCITCPWHGYQYLPENGQSPPPFTEKVATYDLLLLGEKVYIDPRPHPEGTPRPPALIAI